MAFTANNLVHRQPEHYPSGPITEVQPDTFGGYAHLVMAGTPRWKLARSLDREGWEKTVTGFPLIFREGVVAASRYVMFAERQASVLFHLPGDRLTSVNVRVEDWLITPSGLEAGRSRTQRLLSQDFGEPVTDRHQTTDGKTVSTWAEGELLVRLQTSETVYRRTLQVLIERVPAALRSPQ